MTPVEVYVISPIPEGWGLCVTCEAIIAQADLLKTPVDRSLEAFPPDWMDDYRKLSTSIMDLSHKYEKQIIIRIFDPRSIQGMAKALHHLAFKYPAFIINGHGKVTGLFSDQIDQLLLAAGCKKVEIPQ